jgi:decaprenylphospho-beta-D-ribofuranose 2-oxidase
MKITGWGRYPRIDADARSFETESELQEILEAKAPCIVHALGKSYGDSSLNDRVVLTHRFNKLLAFDPSGGIVTCESGVTLSELVDIFLPRGWFLAVTPGTKLITVGGAIASDVHGKNHHAVGCFSECVEMMTVMLPDGSVVECSRETNRDLFRATCGGMGLTGIILTASVKLQPVNSAFIRETVIRCRNLEEIIDGFESHRDTPYSVAWIDCLAKGPHLGRSVLMLGEHAAAGKKYLPPGRRLSVPVDCPGFLLNKASVALFNQVYYKTRPQYVENRIVPLEPFFYPLDQIENWNRMYGGNGFTQYQFVIPKEAGRKGLRTILTRISDAGMGSFLAVLKLFGAENDNDLSFPMEGYTLALDFKIERRLFPFLTTLDQIVLDHGGRLYLAKDVRMDRDMFIRGYPRWEQFAATRDRYGITGRMTSMQSKRLGV